LQLSQGNIAVIAANGLRAEINTWDPTGQATIGESPRASLANPRRPWVLWSVVVLFLAAVAGYGVYFWRRRAASARS
jgi:hypothetical protein